MQHELCALVGQVAAYLERHPEDGAYRLRAFLELDNGKLLLDTADIIDLTGWGRTYISRLCSNGTLPHIPGKPTKFVPAAVKLALEKMQIGAGYGRRKSKMKPTTPRRKDP